MNGSAKRSYKLMIVDDSNIMRRRIERSQQFDELELVGTAGNGLEAIELFRKMDPDVVTMDLTMPQMDGISFLKTLRRQALPLASIPAIVASTEAEDHDKSAARAAGANYYLVKPLHEATLLRYVALLTGRSR